MNIKRKISILTSFILMLSIFMVPNNVFAQSKKTEFAPGFQTKGQLITYLNENQVPKDKQKVLIEKIKNNQMWDSNDPTKQINVPSSFYMMNPEDGNIVRYYRFEDGSFIKLESVLKDSKKIPLNSNEFTNSNIGINPNTVSTGTGYAHYYDYLVSLHEGVLYASMYTDFTLIDGANDYLTPNGFYGASVSGFGELGQMPQIGVVRAQENSSLGQWALADAYWYVNTPISTPWCGISTSGTYYLYLGVGKNTFWVADHPLAY